MEVRKHIYFSGRVQGVGFRYRATYLAQSRKLTGWVKNLWDDRVEVESRGKRQVLSGFCRTCRGSSLFPLTIWTWRRFHAWRSLSFGWCIKSGYYHRVRLSGGDIFSVSPSLSKDSPPFFSKISPPTRKVCLIVQKSP